MTSAAQSLTSSQAETPAAIPPPATKPPRTFPRATVLLDVLLVDLVVVFGFLAACFPAGNSDLFQHLATGRLLAEGTFTFGEDPFSYTTAGVRWVAHSWLFDRGLYALYSWPGQGEQAVVLAKAVLVGFLALVLIAAGRRPGARPWIPAACAALALLALSPRLLLQPACVSFLFLGLTLWVLRSVCEVEGSSPPRATAWLLPPLFALWVNLDENFLLGPAAVALALAGQFLDSWRSGGGLRHLRPLALALAVGLLACLLNPWHFHAFRLPWSLGLTGQPPLAQDREFAFLFLSPVEPAYFRPSLGLNAGGLAFHVLAVLLVGSFALNVTRLRWWRVLVASGFLALALLSYRSVGFFAVAAGPLLALNLLDFAAARPAVRASWGQAGRFASVGLLAALLGLTSCGWLLAPGIWRPVEASVRMDPSLRQAALQVRAWREQGLLRPGDRLFATSPDVACYLAWFCPGERSFLDLRLDLFPAVQDDFVTVRSGLLGEPGKDTGAPRWPEVLRRWEVRPVIFHFRDPRLLSSQPVLVRALASARKDDPEWALCYLDGRTAIASWNDPAHKGGPSPLRLDLDRLAFEAAGRIPDADLARPVPDGRLLGLVPTRPPHPLAGDEAAAYLTLSQALRLGRAQKGWRGWRSALLTASVGSSALPSPGSSFPFRLALALEARDAAGAKSLPPLDQLAGRWQEAYLERQDSADPAALYLGVRAARRGLAEQPPEAQTCFVLGQLYLTLAGQTREGHMSRALPHVALIRQAQAAASLQQTVLLNPDHERAHELLASLSRRTLLLTQQGREGEELLEPVPNREQEQAHVKEQFRCARAAGARPGEAPLAFAQRLEALQKELHELEEVVRKRSDALEVSARGRSPLVRAEQAVRQGLLESALAALLPAYEKAAEGPADANRAALAARLAELLLATGRLGPATELLEREATLLHGVVTPLGLPADEWFGIVRASAAGSYGLADELLAKGEAERRAGPEAVLAQAVAHQLLWDAALATRPPAPVLQRLPVLIGLPPDGRALLSRAWQQALRQLQQQSDRAALRGWLALEAGDLSLARQQLEHVRTLCQVDGRQPLGLRALPLALCGLERLSAATPVGSAALSVRPGGSPR